MAILRFFLIFLLFSGFAVSHSTAQTLECRIIDAYTGEPIAGALLEIFYKNDSTVQTFTSDEKGRVEAKLPLYMHFKISANHRQYKASDYVEIHTLEPEKKKIRKTISLNRINVGFKVVWEGVSFNTNDDSIIPSMFAPLENLCEFLSRNQNIFVELGCHTDSRGDAAHNIKLSERRAQSIKKYLTERCGILSFRLIPKGYGKKELRNQCTEGVLCSTEEHRVNRRLEITVLGVSDLLDP